MKRFMSSTLNFPHPIYIRLAKGGDKVVSEEKFGFEMGKAILMREQGDGLFISTGVMTQLALEAAEKLKEEGIICGVLHIHTIKPLDEIQLAKLLPLVKAVVTVEEHTRIGGLGSAILEFANDNMAEQSSKIKRIGIPDQFAKQYGSQESLLNHWGITVQNLISSMKNKLNL
jgi:transketolase